MTDASGDTTMVGSSGGESATHLRASAIGPGDLVGRHVVLHEQGHPSEAVPLAERAVKLWEQREVAPEQTADARFVLARALFDAPTDAGGDRTRAWGLAARAREALKVAGPGEAEDLAELEAWLVGHAAESP